MALHENQTDWLTLLNSMRIVSTDLISISKFIRDKKELMLKSCILVPKQFSEDVDQDLKVQTHLKKIYYKNKGDVTTTYFICCSSQKILHT